VHPAQFFLLFFRELGLLSAEFALGVTGEWKESGEANGLSGSLLEKGQEG